MTRKLTPPYLMFTVCCVSSPFHMRNCYILVAEIVSSLWVEQCENKAYSSPALPERQVPELGEEFSSERRVCSG